MKQTLKSILLFVILSGSIACKQSPKKTDLAPKYTDAISVLEDAINYEIESKDLNAISMVLVDQNKIIWNKSFGHKDEAKTIAADENTVFRVGSVSKLFTDLAIMQKVESGEIDVDAPITNYLPELTPENPFKKPITLRMLTSHRSGMLREPRIGNYFDGKNDNLEETVKSITNSKIIYEPESKVKYSNAGIGVVGYLLESMFDQEYTAYMSEHVLAKIGMEYSSFAPTAAIKKELAEATMWSFDERSFTAPTFQLGMSPAGSLYAPMSDLGVFLISLFEGGVGTKGRYIKEKTLQEMWTPQFGGDRLDGYGIGFRLKDFKGYQKIGHGGAIYGFSTQLSGVPELKLGVGCASSVDATNSITSRLSNFALDLLYAVRQGEALPVYEKTRHISLEKQKSLAGYYTNEGQGIELITKNGKLFISGDKSELELRQASDGIISDGRLNYGDIMLVEDEEAIRINDRKFTKTNPPTSSTYPDDWNNLIGEYGDDHIVLYFYEKAGHLFTLIEWMEKDKLTQLSENEFAFPESGGMYHWEKFIFERDTNGKAIRVSIENGPVFNRRKLGSASETFRIEPVLPIEELRTMALAANPPSENGNFKESNLVELKSLDLSIEYDIRYASTNNFMSNKFYSLPRAYLQAPAAEALVRVHQKLKERGYGLLIHDAYRPWYVTKMFWDATPEDKKIFVADPSDGSRHNRGAAVDLTLFDLKTGKVIEMVAGYDEMTDRSFPFYFGGNTAQRHHRTLLRIAMEEEGFEVYEYEWWHFDYTDWENYRIQNIQFSEIK